MASKIPGGKGYVELHRRNFREVLKQPAIEDELHKRMQRVQTALPGSEMRTSNRNRARVLVARGSDYDEANTGELSRALDLAGGQRGYKKKRAKPRPRRSSR